MTIEKKPAGATKPVVIDWSAVATGGVTISSSAWSVAPAGAVTLASAGKTDTSAFVTVSGGVNGSLVELRNAVTLSNGAIEERSVSIYITSESID